jgi:hypothetical protein
MTEEERRRMASSAIPKFPEGQPTASIRDWSQNPEVAAAMKTGNVSEIEKATTAARDAYRAGGVWAAGAKEVPLNPIPAQQRTPEQQQALLAQMREKGAAIGERLAGEQGNRYYAFRQGLEERRAQEALSTERGRTPQVMRGAQASVEAERWKQAQAGRNPMSREPMSAFGFQYQQGSMGQYSPVRSIGTVSGMVPSGGPQPASAMQTAPQAGGFMASGIMPSFTSAGTQSQERDEWLRRNFPQDYFNSPFGGQGMKTVSRNTPFDQTRYF